MKDVKEHGNDAHSAEVNAISELGVGNEPYSWEKDEDGVHRLISPGFSPIASVSPARMRPEIGVLKPGMYIGQIHTSFNTGHAYAGNWGALKSVQSAKRWTENLMANSWKPPTIIKK